jgi:hypothetical protein
MWLGAAALAKRADFGGSGGQELLAIRQEDVARATENLQQWSVDLVQWKYDTSVPSDDVSDASDAQRWDIVASPYLARDQKTPIMRDILKPQERAVTHWNADPYVLAVQGGGGVEFAPCEWTLPYWLLVYYGALAA